MTLEAIVIPAAQAAGKQMVREILSMDRELVGLLEAVDGELEAFRQGPYHAARDLLQAADRPGRPAGKRAQDLEKARERFIDAHAAHRDDAVMQSFAALHVALIHHARGESGEASHWAAVAHEHGVEATRKRLSDYLDFLDRTEALGTGSKDRKVAWVATGRLHGAGLAISFAGAAAGMALLPVMAVGAGAGYAAYKVAERRRAHHAREETDDITALADYVSVVGIVRAELGARPLDVPQYQLISGHSPRDLSYLTVRQTG